MSPSHPRILWSFKLYRMGIRAAGNWVLVPGCYLMLSEYPVCSHLITQPVRRSYLSICVSVRVRLACCPEDGLCSQSSLLQVMVVDGASGSVVWSYSAPCHMERSPATSAVTSDQKSVFLFWAEGLSAAPPNSVSEPGRIPLLLCQMAAGRGLTGPEVP